MPPDRTVVHATWTPGDVDCFALAPVATEQTVDVSVDTPNEINLDVELLVDGKTVAVANKAGKGAVEKLADVAVPAGKPVFVKLTLKSGGSSTERYRLRWSAIPGEDVAPVPGLDEEP